MEKQFSTFFIGDALFGIDILLVNEINRHLELTPIEQAPDFVRGLLNLRGQIITVLDLGVRLGLGTCSIDRQSRCVVLKTSQALNVYKRAGILDDDTSEDIVGLLVDRIGEMVSVDSSEIELPPANVTGIDDKYISGVVKLEKDLMVSLRVREILKENSSETDRV